MLLLDLDAGNESGLEILNKIRKIQPEIKTLVLSMHSEPLKIQQACNENIFELYSTLSRKEQEVFSLFTRGMNTKEAAANLGKGNRRQSAHINLPKAEHSRYDTRSLENIAKALGI